MFDGSRVEPTDESLVAAVEHARETGPWDAYVAVGGGSSIDTAKAVDLMTTNPGSCSTTSTRRSGRAGRRSSRCCR